MEKNKWLIYTRGLVPLYRVVMVLQGVPRLATRMGGSKLDKVVIATSGKKTIFCWEEQEMKKLFRIIISTLEDKEARDIHFKKMENYVKKALQRADTIRHYNLKKCTSKKLSGLYDYLYQESERAHIFTVIDIDAMDICFEEFLKNKLRREIKKYSSLQIAEQGQISEAEFSALYNKLTTPLYRTFVSSEEIALMEAALDKRANHAHLQKLYDQFWWTRLGWENMRPCGKNEYNKRISTFSKARNLKKKIYDLKNRVESLKKQRWELLDKYNLSKELNYWLEIIDKYAYFHDLRKEMQVRTIYSFYLLLEEVARRYNLKKKDLEWLWYDEIKKILKNRCANPSAYASLKKEIKNRKLSTYIETSHQGIYMLSGKEATEKIKTLVKEKKNDINELKGLGVSGGYIKGRVKVCNGADEALSKVKKGDILVCGMTLPDYVPSMKKALAIITNEGGITCHAAIISRELRIPCVVGTKIATHVLKDGDMVEINAAQGIIKIL